MNVGDLTAKLKLDTAEFEKSANGVNNSLSKLASGITGALGAVTATIGSAVAASAAAIGSITKSAVESYAEYEQLVGGIETLFKDSAGIVQDYAVEAYKNAGISANKYMETVTSFSASLIQGLGGDTEKAAEYANRAIVDMSDNANKMGTDIASIQNAYQGFAKQNYTMLDNLKLGYGGTKEEMERLIKHASTLTNIQRELNVTVDEGSMSFDNIINAISVVQKELDITGTTMNEASTTISGSLNMLQGAWSDLLTSMAGGGIGTKQAIDNLVESAEIFLQNVVPVIEEALYGIGDLIQGIAPIIAERLPVLLSELIPMILETAIYLVNSLIENLPMLVETIAEALISILPQLVSAVVNLLDSLLSTIIPTLFEVAVQLVLAIGQGIADNIQQLTETVISLIVFIVQTIIEHLPGIILVGLQILSGFIEGILNNIHLITDAVVIMISTFVLTIFEHLPDILKAAVEIGLKIVAGIMLAIPSLIVSVGRMLGIVQSTKDQIEDHSTKMQNSVNDSTNGITSSIDSMIDNLNNKTNQARGMLTNTSSTTSDVSDEMNRKADDMVKTSQSAEKTVKLVINNTVNSVVFARASFQQAFEDMTKWLEAFKLKMEELGKMVAMPKVDPSGVEAGCRSIIDAVDRAIQALQKLGSAQSSAGFSGSIGYRASGGPVSAGSPYIVGEAGPEMFMPKSSGYIINAEETVDLFGGGRGDIIINIQGDVYDDEQSIRRKFHSAVVDILEMEMANG